MRVEERGRDGLVHLADGLEAERRQRLAVTLHGERGIGAASRIRHRPPDDHLSGKRIELRRGVAPHDLEKRREEILELVRASVDPGRLEEPARREGLERLDEAAVAGVLDEALDRPRSRLARNPRMVVVALVPEAQRRAEGEEKRGEEVEDDGLGAMAVRPREHGVRRAEVEAERAASGGHASFAPTGQS